MKATFNLKNFLTENRETIIAQYNETAKLQFFNGITLKDFMIQILNAYERNNVKSEKRAKADFDLHVGNTCFQNSKLNAVDYRTDALRAKYNGTAYMAMV